MTETEKTFPTAGEFVEAITHPTSARKYKLRSEDVHDWDNLPIVEGVVLKKDSQKIEKDTRRYMLVDTGEFVARVYETSALEELFNSAVVGDHVYLEFVKMTQTKKAGRKFRQFKYRVWEE